MTSRVQRAGVLGLTLALCAVLVSGCDSQAAVRPAAAATGPSTLTTTPGPYPPSAGPYDETPITPMETVGAAREE